MTPPRRLILLMAALFSTADSVSLSSILRSQTLQGAGLKAFDMHSEIYQSNSSSAKSMEVQGHTVSQVSARWTGKVVYGIFTSKIQKYRTKLEIQLETWAARPAKEGRYVAVGGRDYPEDWVVSGSILRSKCRDDMHGISCKEATLLAEGAARGADWLMITGEDNYVNTRSVEIILQTKDPSQAVAYGIIGCGGDKFCRDSEAMRTHGGFCGGGGYIISRAALQLLVADGAPALHKVYDESYDPNDMTTSCQLWKHGAVLQPILGMNYLPMFMAQTYQTKVHTFFITMHYLEPGAMRWVHAEVENLDASVKQKLFNEAFEHGCARGMNQSRWAKGYAHCHVINKLLYP